MADFRPAPPPVRSGACPQVGELIDYAQGVLSGTDRQRIEAHLQGNSCGHCRSWIEKAAGLSASAPRPADASAKWDRQAAFRDLQQRLQSLEGAD